jgi:RHS repeat-associated protein
VVKILITIVQNKDGSVKETWDYVNGVEYKNQILQRVAHSEGAVVRNDFGQYQHEYVLRDHLGNTRVTFTDGVNKGEPYWNWSNYTYIVPDNTGYDDGVVTEADIKHINHTYPFGMAMEGNWNNTGTANNNRYLYNGKQWNDDFGMGWYDYGARFYDPSIARWSAVDPLAEKYQRWSVYNYCLDNPVKFIDPDGMEVAGMSTTIGTKAMTMEEQMQAHEEAKLRAQELKQKEYNSEHQSIMPINLKYHIGITGTRTSKSKKSGKKEKGGEPDPPTPTISVKKPICFKSLDLETVGSQKGCSIGKFNLEIKVGEKPVSVPFPGMVITCTSFATAEHVADYFTDIVADVQKHANESTEIGTMSNIKKQAELLHVFQALFNESAGREGTSRSVVGMKYINDPTFKKPESGCVE